jgi:hypothetical protein
MVAGLLFASGLCWLMRSPVRKIAPYHPISGLPDNIEMRLNHVVFHGVSGGKIVWEIEADHFDVTQNQVSFRATGLKRIALLKEGKQELMVSAESLERNIFTGDIALAGHVTVMGDNMLLRTPNIVWNDRLQLFTVPGQIGAQFGDITLTSDGGTVYNVNAATVRANGHLLLAVKGNAFSAHGASLNLVTQTFSIDGPAHAKAIVADLQQWGHGQNLPHIPEIPESIKERYRAFRRSHGMN